jgi:DNA-binding MarR family transcriptional regulator
MTHPAPSNAPNSTALQDTLLREFIGYNMKRSYLIIQADMMATIADLGLRQTTFSALATIIENPDITQTQLGQALSIERSGVVLIVDEMENADIITRNKVKTDRRSYALRATLRGRRLWEKASLAVGAHEDKLLSTLTAQERATLKDMLNRIEANGRATDQS